MELTPDMIAFRDRLDAWRARTEDERIAYFQANPPESIRAMLARVNVCPHRGSVLPLSLQSQEDCRCGEVSECRTGQGTIPGRVTLRECLACVSVSQRED